MTTPEPAARERDQVFLELTKSICPVCKTTVTTQSPTVVIDGVDASTGKPVEGEPRCRMDLPSRDHVRAAAMALRRR
jgi:hypothetical protein